MDKPHIYKCGVFWFVDESGLLFKKEGLSIQCGIVEKGFTARSAWLRYKRAIRARKVNEKSRLTNG